MKLFRPFQGQIPHMPFFEAHVVSLCLKPFGGYESILTHYMLLLLGFEIYIEILVSWVLGRGPLGMEGKEVHGGYGQTSVYPVSQGPGKRKDPRFCIRRYGEVEGEGRECRSPLTSSVDSLVMDPSTR